MSLGGLFDVFRNSNNYRIIFLVKIHHYNLSGTE